MLMVSKPFWTGCGCVSIYYECVPQSSKYLLWTSLVLTHTRPFDFCQGGLQSACQRVAVVYIGRKLWLKICLGVSCAHWLAGSENMKAFWLSKLISINRGPAVVTQCKTHAAVKEAFLHSQCAIGTVGREIRFWKCSSGKSRLGWYSVCIAVDGKLLFLSKWSGFQPLCIPCWRWAKLLGFLSFLIPW